LWPGIKTFSPSFRQTTRALLRLEAPAQRQGGWMPKLLAASNSRGNFSLDILFYRTESAMLGGEGERFTLKGRRHATTGASASGAHPAERGSSREYWPFLRQCMPVRQPEARRIRSGNSFGSAVMAQFEWFL